MRRKKLKKEKYSYKNSTKILSFFQFGTALLALLMMTAVSTLSKHQVLGITVALKTIVFVIIFCRLTR